MNRNTRDSDLIFGVAFFVLVLLVAALLASTMPRPPLTTSATDGRINNIDSTAQWLLNDRGTVATTDIDMWLKHKVELAKLLEERRKNTETIYTEQFKGWLSALAILPPLLVGIATAYVAVRNQRRQAVDAFQLKAAEMVVSSRSPAEAVQKAATFQMLFADMLPPGFAASIEGRFVERHGSAGKMELLKMLASDKVDTDDKKANVLRLWLSLFPNDVSLPEVEVLGRKYLGHEEVDAAKTKIQSEQPPTQLPPTPPGEPLTGDEAVTAKRLYEWVAVNEVTLKAAEQAFRILGNLLNKVKR